MSKRTKALNFQMAQKLSAFLVRLFFEEKGLSVVFSHSSFFLQLPL